MWLTGRLKLKGKTAFLAESSWCKSAIGTEVPRRCPLNTLISLAKSR